MEKWLLVVAKRFWPELEEMGGQERRNGVGNVLGVLYAAPLALAGLTWLVSVTDITLMRREWLLLCLCAVLIPVFDRFSFFFFGEVTPGVFFDWQNSLEDVVTWSAPFMFGPSALWLSVPWRLIDCARWWQRSTAAASRWACVRDCALNLSGILARMVALTLYGRWGGVFPLPGLALAQVLPAFGATFAGWMLSTLIWVPYLVYHTYSGVLITGSPGTHVRFGATAMGLNALTAPFAVLAAGLHAQNRLGGYLFVVAGVLLTSLLAHRLSQAAERSQQRSRELEKLEQLGRALLTCCLDASEIAQVLQEHVSTMFPSSLVEIHIYPSQTMMRHVAQEVRMPPERLSVQAAVWEWLRTTPEAHCFLSRETLPWDTYIGQRDHAVVVVPILDIDSAELLGGIYLSGYRHPEAAINSLPAVQSLATQIASALYSAEVYAQTLAHQRVEQELALAGRVQASFLPAELPDVPGWQIAATLVPARETSGDFYDVFSLSNGRLGIVIADVADKGMGAALYMARCSSLIRTYACWHETRPNLALELVNHRILTDTRADLFVTVFYGVLDPSTGTLTYCNAGHNPPYHLYARNGDDVEALCRTGMPLGILDGTAWEEKTTQLDPGDVLVLYTDGITEAQNAQEMFFGEKRLQAIVQANLGRSAGDIQDAAIAKVHEFVGGAPQFDDITLMVVVRGSAGAET